MAHKRICDSKPAIPEAFPPKQSRIMKAECKLLPLTEKCSLRNHLLYHDLHGLSKELSTASISTSLASLDLPGPPEISVGPKPRATSCSSSAVLSSMQLSRPFHPFRNSFFWLLNPHIHLSSLSLFIPPWSLVQSPPQLNLEILEHQGAVLGSLIGCIHILSRLPPPAGGLRCRVYDNGFNSSPLIMPGRITYHSTAQSTSPLGHLIGISTLVYSKSTIKLFRLFYFYFFIIWLLPPTQNSKNQVCWVFFSFLKYIY